MLTLKQALIEEIYRIDKQIKIGSLQKLNEIQLQRELENVIMGKRSFKL